jgi:hypothetical protein
LRITSCWLFGFWAQQGALKEEKKTRRTYLPTFFLRFFEIFRSDFRKYVCGVFELLMQRNGQKRDKKKSKGKATGEKIGKKFLAWISPIFLMAFLNSPC